MRRPLARGILGALLASAVAACGGGHATDAGDAGGTDGARTDVSHGADTGTGTDVGPGDDSGTRTDTGTTTDTGPMADTVSPPDVVTPRDSGTVPDGGTMTGSACTRPLFPATAAWNQRATGMARDAQSDAIIAQLSSLGWGGGHLQLDTSFFVQCDAHNTAPRRSYTPNSDYAAPDCDTAPVPLPVGGHLEGETGYDCTSGGDCHLIVIEPLEHRLYEMWEPSVTGSTFTGACLAIWDTSTYSPLGRGDQCTSADAGGFPIAAMLFNADEVASGHIDHAIRLILPPDRIERRTYVRPSTHATNTSGGATAVPYGARFRIRDDRLAAVLAAMPNAYARTVVQAMHDYGIFLADGGNIALTAEDDSATTHHWDNATDNRAMATGLGTHDLFGVQVTDFEMVDGGTRIAFGAGGGCARTPITH